MEDCNKCCDQISPDDCVVVTEMLIDLILFVTAEEKNCFGCFNVPNAANMSE